MPSSHVFHFYSIINSFKVSTVIHWEQKHLRDCEAAQMIMLVIRDSSSRHRSQTPMPFANIFRWHHGRTVIIVPVCVEKDTWQPALQLYLESLNAEWTFDGESDLSVSKIIHDKWAVAFKESTPGSQITSGCLRKKKLSDHRYLTFSFALASLWTGDPGVPSIPLCSE